MEAISLSCPSCGSNLEITNDIDRFACGYCGKQLLVNRSGGIVSIKPLVEKLESIGFAVDRTASELAISRLKGEIGEIQISLEKAYSSKDSVGKLTFYCIVGLLAGVAGILISIQNNTNSYFLCGIVPIVLAGALLFFTIWAKKGWERKIIGIENELNQKKVQLEKHLHVVNG